MTKTNETMMLMGDLVPIYICDQCERPTEGSSLHWPDKDFTLCAACIEKSYQLMFETPRINHTSRTSRKKVIPAKLKKEVFERDGYRCRYCGSHKDLTADHVYPESRGGDTSVGNLVTACSECNSKKGARTPEEAAMTLKEIGN
ncbi:HNH endonuclease [compost metagenome]